MLIRCLIAGLTFLGLLVPTDTRAQAPATVKLCVQSGSTCVPVTAGNPLPVTGGGGGGGGTSALDASAFTTGTTPITPTGGLFNDAATLSSGQVGAPRLTTKRAQIVDVDSTGNALYSAITAAVPCLNATAFNTNSYSNAGTNPANCDLHGNLYVNVGTLPALPANQSVNVTQWASGNLGAMANYGTSPGAVLVPGVNAFVTNPVTVAQATAASLNATVVGTGTFQAQISGFTSWAGGTLGAMANYGTSPGAVLVPGTNAFITNTPPVSQSGTWTVQPGNTANTTPWLATINQGGNSAAVTGANALKVDGSAVTQPVSGTVTNNNAVNVTATDCSGTITSGGTAQNAIAAQTTLHGFTIANIDTGHNAEVLWISFTGTAASLSAGSYPLPAPTATTFAGFGSFTTPPGFGTNHAVSIIGATTGHVYSCTFW